MTAGKATVGLYHEGTTSVYEAGETMAVAAGRSHFLSACPDKGCCFHEDEDMSSKRKTMFV